jgi:hypothetical protein
MEVDFQAGDADKGRSILSSCFNSAALSGSTIMELKMAPVTPASSAEKPASSMLNPQATGLCTPPLAPWQDKEKQYPHKHLLLPADVVKAKMVQLCNDYSSR